MKIQVSEITAEMLLDMGGFELEKRGHVDVKVGLFKWSSVPHFPRKLPPTPSRKNKTGTNIE